VLPPAPAKQSDRRRAPPSQAPPEGLPQFARTPRRAESSGTCFPASALPCLLLPGQSATALLTKQQQSFPGFIFQLRGLYSKKSAIINTTVSFRAQSPAVQNAMLGTRKQGAV
jgi:hypothetical protein